MEGKTNYFVGMPPSPTLRGTYRTDLPARAVYAEGAGIYRIVPTAIAIPADTADLVQLVRWAGTEGIPLVPRGAGSGMAGGNVGDGVIVDLHRIGGRGVSVQADRRRAATAASVTHLELNRAAGVHGLRLPPDPSSGRFATLGGMLSTNAAGARTVRYGSVRRWVEAAEIVTAEGDLVRLERGRKPGGSAAALTRFESDVAPRIREAAPVIAAAFPATRKNSSGYALDAWLASGDLLDLFIGAEGTLGIVTQIDWRLDRHPGATAAIRVSLASLDQLAGAVESLRAHGPSAVELLDRSFLELVQGKAAAAAGGPEAVLLVELEGENAAAAAAAAQAAARSVQPHAARVETALTADAIDRLWAIRHAASPILAGLPETRRSLQVIEDGCVPLARLGEYVREVRGAARERGLDIVLFGHAGDGHLHCNLLPEVARDGWERSVAALLDEIAGVVASLGGTLSGEHGDGRLRAPFLDRIFGAEVVSLFRDVKSAFDPRGILNPGVKLGSARPVTRLKAGGAAAPLPDGIAAALRDLERSAGYATPRLELLD
jgi:FAD/FMN-containing dehydrogenase